MQHLGICFGKKMAANKRDTGKPTGKNARRQLWPRSNVKAEAVADFQGRIIGIELTAAPFSAEAVPTDTKHPLEQ
jgi:hypothetical protein